MSLLRQLIRNFRLLTNRAFWFSQLFRRNNFARCQRRSKNRPCGRNKGSASASVPPEPPASQTPGAYPLPRQPATPSCSTVPGSSGQATDQAGKGIGIVSPADTKPVPASKIKLNPAACHNRRRVFMPHIRNYLDRQKASLLLCIAIRRKPPIPQPRKHGIGIHIIPPRNLTRGC